MVNSFVKAFKGGRDCLLAAECVLGKALEENKKKRLLDMARNKLEFHTGYKHWLKLGGGGGSVSSAESLVG